MSVSDYRYINELVVQAQLGDSNAFAELFAATSQEQYAFACRFLGDGFAAQEVLQETYIYALKNLSMLRDPSLMIAWLNQNNMRNCMKHRYLHEKAANPEARVPDPESRLVTIGKRRFSVRSILKLPFTQAQVLLLRYLCGLRKSEIAELVGIPGGEVHRYIRSGSRALHDAPWAKEVSPE